jgi:hypothetical protein
MITTNIIAGKMQERGHSSVLAAVAAVVTAGATCSSNNDSSRCKV